MNAYKSKILYISSNRLTVRSSGRRARSLVLRTVFPDRWEAMVLQGRFKADDGPAALECLVSFWVLSSASAKVRFEPEVPDAALSTNGRLVKEFRLWANFSNDYSLAHPWNTALGYSFREPLREVEKFQFGLELAH